MAWLGEPNIPELGPTTAATEVQHLKRGISVVATLLRNKARRVVLAPEAGVKEPALKDYAQTRPRPAKAKAGPKAKATADKPKAAKSKAQAKAKSKLSKPIPKAG